MKKRHKIEQPEFESESSEEFESSTSSIPVDDFCIPDGCPERIETPKFSSPTSCLSEERLHALEERIDAANRLLLDLGLSNEQSENGRRILFDGLKGKTVKIKVRCSHEESEEHPEAEAETGTIGADVQSDIELKKHFKKSKKKRLLKKKLSKKNRLQFKAKRKTWKKNKNIIEGVVELVGRDFVQLKKKGQKFLIPYSKVCVTLTKKHYQLPVHEPSLIDIEPCFRRELTFNFGETVANDPELVQLFFRIKLSMYLKTSVGERILVKTDNERLQGIVRSIDSHNIIIDNTAASSTSISMNSVCYIIK
jgi:small nuclear ribonucleoprotein (snRNP)-like protein